HLRQTHHGNEGGTSRWRTPFVRTYRPQNDRSIRPFRFILIHPQRPHEWVARRLVSYARHPIARPLRRNGRPPLGRTAKGSCGGVPGGRPRRSHRVEVTWVMGTWRGGGLART